MSTDSTAQVNGNHIGEYSSGFLPGTTFPEKQNVAGPPSSSPRQSPGPEINSKQTTLTLYTPPQLQTLRNTPLMLSLFNIINTSFSQSHASNRVLPAGIDRLQSQDQYLQQIGSDPGTFVYILTWSDEPETPIATAGAHRYVAPVLQATEDDVHVRAFERVRAPAGVSEGSEMWELKLMAVDLSLQGRGLASWLMELVDREAGRVFKAEAKREERELWMLLTTLKEINGAFYERRGYVDDYEISFPKGVMGSETGFTVVHMSKRMV